MLTLDVFEDIQLTPVPVMQKAVGWIIRANYRLPGTRTRVEIEGLENLPRGRPVYLAMNHTDRFNYWPLQVALWRDYQRFTATWVKGKYYNHPASRKFMVWTNNIPAPSRGYLITADAASVIGAPEGDLYRLLRDAINTGTSDEELLEQGKAHGYERQIQHLMKTPRDMLGLNFNPMRDGYVECQRELFRKMMDHFIRLNQQAFDLDLSILVFPEGTRSLTLGQGRPGLAQMALRTNAAIVPIGCNGSNLAYPSDNPFSRGGRIVYRIGKPLLPENELAPYAISEEFRPFTNEADQFADKFDGVTSLVMDRIAELLDPVYLGDRSTAVAGANRFL